MGYYLIGSFKTCVYAPDSLGTYSELMQNDFVEMVLCVLPYKNLKR